MSHGIYSALSGAIAQQTVLETTATNLANVSTTGYREIRPVFHEVLARQARRGEGAHFTSVRRTQIDTSQGSIRETGNPLDLVLPKDAYLAVESPGGERFTRAASLRVAPNGVLVTQQGNPVLNDQRQRITVDPATPLTITNDGEVKAEGSGIGFLRVLTFARPEEMSYEGYGLLSANAQAGGARPALDRIEVGALEESNASPVRAMNDLMMAARTFEAMENAIESFSRIDRRLVNSVPKAT